MTSTRQTSLTPKCIPAQKYSVRIAGRVTSVSVRPDILSLWLVLADFDVLTKDQIDEQVLTFIYACLDEWVEASAKGLSAFVMESMIKSVLEYEDYESYLAVRNKLIKQ